MNVEESEVSVAETVCGQQTKNEEEVEYSGHCSHNEPISPLCPAVYHSNSIEFGVEQSSRSYPQVLLSGLLFASCAGLVVGYICH